MTKSLGRIITGCIILSAAAMCDLVAGPTTSTTSAPTSAPASAPTEWKLPNGSVISFNDLAVGNKGRTAVFLGDIFIPSGDPNKPPKHEGGRTLVDLVTGKFTLVADLPAADEAKSFAMAVWLPPSGNKIAVSVIPNGSEGPGFTVNAGYLIDVEKKTSVKLGGSRGGMNMLWVGDRLLVSRRNAIGMEAIDTFDNEGKKVEAKPIRLWVVGASADGKRLIGFANGKDATKEVNFEKDSDAALVVVDSDGKIVKRLAAADEIMSVISPSGTWAAFMTIDRSARKTGIRVSKVDADGNRDIEGVAMLMPLAVTDSGAVYTMERPRRDSYDKNGKGAAVTLWPAKGEPKIIAKDALDACIVGDTLYYIAVGDPPILKAVKITGDAP